MNLGKCSNMPTCGGIGTYLPNYHTMQVSGQGENDRKNDILFLHYFQIFRQQRHRSWIRLLTWRSLSNRSLNQDRLQVSFLQAMWQIVSDIEHNLYAQWENTIMQHNLCNSNWNRSVRTIPEGQSPRAVWIRETRTNCNQTRSRTHWMSRRTSFLYLFPRRTIQETTSSSNIISKWK